MQIQILCIGKIKDQWISEGISVFETRLKPYCSMTLTVLPEVRIPENASAAEENMVREKEGE
ncbi:MAG: 23S rRNA (pseudouridine(1915)-N(3))-methyltransferase RlmH, partial [Methanocorpusculum sp.]|nr:23S rRNA (pseudouridine(1915)-N(3))-methyltransferase RlmH [Methanocorpusculum sp.]